MGLGKKMEEIILKEPLGVPLIIWPHLTAVATALAIGAYTIFSTPINKIEGENKLRSGYPLQRVYDTNGDGKADITKSIIAGKGIYLESIRKSTQEEKDWYKNK